MTSHLLFFATDSTHGRELWVTDGTAAGTTLVKDIQSGFGQFRIQRHCDRRPRLWRGGVCCQ